MVSQLYCFGRKTKTHGASIMFATSHCINYYISWLTLASTWTPPPTIHHTSQPSDQSSSSDPMAKMESPKFMSSWAERSDRQLVFPRAFPKNRRSWSETKMSLDVLSRSKFLNFHWCKIQEEYTGKTRKSSYLDPYLGNGKHAPTNQPHCCFREYHFYNHFISIPIIPSTSTHGPNTVLVLSENHGNPTIPWLYHPL